MAYPFLKKLLSPFEKRRQKTMALVIAAMAVTGQARSMAIATTLGRWLMIGLGSALNRFYRLMRNTRMDYTEFVASWAELLARTKERALLVAVDWTEWHHDLRLLTAFGRLLEAPTLRRREASSAREGNESRAAPPHPSRRSPLITGCSYPRGDSAERPTEGVD